MPIAPNSIAPQLIEQIFRKYEKTFQRQREKGLLGKNSYKSLFTELYSIFGHVLILALRLLDEQSITIYKTDSQFSRTLVEITEGRRNNRVIKLFPDLNYCNCDNFLIKVLGIDHFGTSTLSSNKSYTCQHVLAFRLAFILDASCIRQEILPKHKFNFLLMQMRENDDFNDNNKN